MSTIYADIKRLFAEEDNQINKITECYEKARETLYQKIMPQSISAYNRELAKELYKLGIRYKGD